MGRETLFFSLVAFIAFAFCIEVALFNDVEPNHNLKLAVPPRFAASNTVDRNHHPISPPAHLIPHIPIFPLFNSISNAEDHIASLLDGRPSMVGVVALLQKFLSALHDSNMEVINTEASSQTMLDNFFRLTEKIIKPFDNAYKGKLIFPVREDGSIFISIAAFREFYLLETLVSAFKNAKNPEKVFVGAVVQNCFGKLLEDGTLDTSGAPCFSGPQYAGKGKNGKDIRKVNDAPVDKNGIEAFCALPDYEQYCKNGQIRVLYMHHIDGQGPSMARYYASKLWGGENFFMQIDSHLRFAHEWDAKYITDAELTLNYPKSVLSAYPPGFEQVRFIPKHMNVDFSKIDNETVIESPGCRLCRCGTPKGVNPIIHITQTKSYEGNVKRPAQTPFLGAGLVFAHGDFLKDIPFDPYLPWTFMGEEILLSMRAWTHGWNIYAPRKNLIIHQYRPAKLGLPKFHTSIQRT
jgi:[Skp1-protein]-hydroxyproline N-acetylglucosaminyltransferase